MKKLKLILLLSGILIFCSACLTSSEFNHIEQAIIKEIHPAKVKTNFKFSFGPISLSTAETFVSFTDEGREASKYLHEISKVQVGIYEIEKTSRPFQLKIPHRVEKELNELGWEIFIRAKEKDEHVNLFYKQVNEHIGSLYVIVLEKDEMVIVEVRGRLDKLIEEAIQKHGFPQKEMLKSS